MTNPSLQVLTYMLVEKVQKLSSVAQIQSQLALYIDPAQNSKTVTFAMVKQKLRMCKYRYICEVHDDLKVIGKVFYQHSKGKNNQTQLLKIVADFIKNVQFQWAVFLKDIKDKGIDEYQKLKTNKDLTSKIEEMEKLVLEKIVKPKLEACIDKQPSIQSAEQNSHEYSRSSINSLNGGKGQGIQHVPFSKLIEKKLTQKTKEQMNKSKQQGRRERQPIQKEKQKSPKQKQKSLSKQKNKSPKDQSQRSPKERSPKQQKRSPNNKKIVVSLKKNEQDYTHDPQNGHETTHIKRNQSPAFKTPKRRSNPKDKIVVVIQDSEISPFQNEPKTSKLDDNKQQAQNNDKDLVFEKKDKKSKLQTSHNSRLIKYEATDQLLNQYQLELDRILANTLKKKSHFTAEQVNHIQEDDDEDTKTISMNKNIVYSSSGDQHKSKSNGIEKSKKIEQKNSQKKDQQERQLNYGNVEENIPDFQIRYQKSPVKETACLNTGRRIEKESQKFLKKSKHVYHQQREQRRRKQISPEVKSKQIEHKQIAQRASSPQNIVPNVQKQMNGTNVQSQRRAIPSMRARIPAMKVKFESVQKVQKKSKGKTPEMTSSESSSVREQRKSDTISLQITSQISTETFHPLVLVQKTNVEAKQSVGEAVESVNAEKKKQTNNDGCEKSSETISLNKNESISAQAANAEAKLNDQRETTQFVINLLRQPLDNVKNVQNVSLRSRNKSRNLENFKRVKIQTRSRRKKQKEQMQAETEQANAQHENELADKQSTQWKKTKNNNRKNENKITLRSSSIVEKDFGFENEPAPDPSKENSKEKQDKQIEEQKQDGQIDEQGQVKSPENCAENAVDNGEENVANAPSNEMNQMTSLIGTKSKDLSNTPSNGSSNTVEMVASSALCQCSEEQKSEVENDPETKQKKTKVKKYKMIMTSYISWIATNVFQFLLTPPQMTCERHMNSGINLTCSVCLEYSSELEAFQSFCKMESPKYLLNSLECELTCLKSGKINLQKIIILLNQIKKWVDEIGGGYLEETKKKNLVIVDTNIIVCLQKIIKLKNLNDDYMKLIKMRSEEYKLSYDKGLPLNEDMREVRLTRNQYKNKFEQMRYGKFMSIIAKDQSYNVLRIRFSCFQDDIKTNREESEISQETKQKMKDQRRNLGYNKIWRGKRCLRSNQQFFSSQDQFLSKKKRRTNIYDEEESQDSQSSDMSDTSVINDDIYFVNQYSLKSNLALVRKFRSKLEIDWRKVLQIDYGYGLPEKICLDTASTIGSRNQKNLIDDFL